MVRQGEESELFISQASFARIFLLTIGINLLALSFTLITFTLVMKLKPYLNDKFLEFLFLISFSSYAIYLFHRPALDFITRFLRSFIYEEYWVFILSLILSLPLILILSYFAQSWNNKLLKQLPGVVQIPLLRKSDGI
jgi:peptidoglycan/LPS O-acetylase OafA/YrhL